MGSGVSASMASDVLACSVRECHRPLTRGDRTYVCERGHTFDIARSGYLNLLQPQDRRSSAAGDATGALDARSRLLAAGIGCAILDAFVDRAAGLDLPENPVVVDLGCGTGDALAALAARRRIRGIGIDLSAQAIDRAAHRFPHLTWLVANADRRLPLVDAGTDLVLSLNARRNPSGCARVLPAGGRLLVGLPAPDDLVELRAHVQGGGSMRGRSQGVIDEHASAFQLADHATVRERHRLGGSNLRDLLSGTYRGARLSQRARQESLEALDVTLASDVLVFERR